MLRLLAGDNLVLAHPHRLGEVARGAGWGFRPSPPLGGPRPPSPKSVARDLMEIGDTFNQYVSRYGICGDAGGVCNIG